MGRCAVVTDSENGMLCGTGSLFVRLLKKKALPEYVCQIISSDSMKQHLQNVSQGVTMANLNKEIIGGLNILVPPISLQVTYVNYLNKLEQLKTQQQAALSQQNQLFATLQHQAFTGQL